MSLSLRISRFVVCAIVVLPLLAANVGQVRAEELIDVGDDLYRRGLYEEAITWWEQAALDGSANAAYRLGVAHNDGVASDTQTVISRDFAEAAKWYMMAAERGDERAHFDLGALYDNGQGVPKSDELAAKWYLAGAERGQMACQYNVATMYESGEGVEKDLVAAYMWYYLAAQQDFIEFGGPALEKLAGQMEPEQVRDAIRMAKNYDFKEGAR